MGGEGRLPGNFGLELGHGGWIEFSEVDRSIWNILGVGGRGPTHSVREAV